MEEFPSGQRGQTVNLLRFASVVRIHPPPPRRSKRHIVCSDFFIKSQNALILLLLLSKSQPLRWVVICCRRQHPRGLLRSQPADFIAKLQIALKECAESEYWLELLLESGYCTQQAPLSHCVELKKLLIASLNTAKSKQGNSPQLL